MRAFLVNLAKRSVMVNLTQALGAALLVAGVAMVFIPAAVMAAGAGVAFLGWLHDDGGTE